MKKTSKKKQLQFNLKKGKGCKINKGVIFYGNVVIEDNVLIDSFCVIKDSVIKSKSQIKAYSSIEDANIGKNCNIGPYANIRPGTSIGDNSDIGNYVEIKNSLIGNKGKINHMSFIGDAVIEDNVIIGAGTITCNHDGKDINKTYIKSNAYIGSGVRLIAPLEVGEGSTIAAGSVIVKNVPSNKLTISRVDQKVIENWKRKN